MKIRGLVMKVEKNGLIILSPEGEVRRVPLPRRLPRVGEEIEVTVAQGWNHTLAVAAVAALLILAVGGAFLQSQILAPVSYLALDINPSFGLYLDGNQRVIRGEGLNQEGNELLAAVPVKGLALHRALENLVAAAVARGYVRAGTDNIILAAVVPLREGGTVPDLDSLVVAVNSGLDQDHRALVVAQAAAPADLEVARKEGVSLNKYLVRVKGKSRGKDLPLPALQKKPLAKVLEEAGTSIEEILLPEEWTAGHAKGLGKGQEEKVLRRGKGVVVSRPLHPAGDASPKSVPPRRVQRTGALPPEREKGPKKGVGNPTDVPKQQGKRSSRD